MLSAAGSSKERPGGVEAPHTRRHHHDPEQEFPHEQIDSPPDAAPPSRAFRQGWEQAVNEFSERILELAEAVKKIIDEERRRNPALVRSFEGFYALCRQAINPNLSEEAVDLSVTQWDIFHYIYAVLHHPEYRERYAANLRRELPRIPLATSAAPSLLRHPVRSRGTPCLPIPSSAPKRSSLCELRPAAFMGRTALYAGRQRNRTRDLSTLQRDSHANPITPLKMTRVKGRRKTRTSSARWWPPASV